MIDRHHTLPMTRQTELLGISRGRVYYLPRPVSDSDLALLRRINELHLEHPFLGARLLRDTLNREGVRRVGRRHVATRMKRRRAEALYRRPNTSRKHPAHPVYPYLLRGLTIDGANHVWALDITYVPMARGFVYLCVVLDWASRKVLAHRVSISLDAGFCVEALTNRNIRISRDGKGAWRDNVFVERLWWTVKYEEVYLKAYDSVRQARESIGRYLAFYNAGRPHSSLDNQTPDEFCLKPLPAFPKAA